MQSRQEYFTIKLKVLDLKPCKCALGCFKTCLSVVLSVLKQYIDLQWFIHLVSTIDLNSVRIMCPNNTHTSISISVCLGARARMSVGVFADSAAHNSRHSYC